jgi:hypothetical protein
LPDDALETRADVLGQGIELRLHLWVQKDKQLSHRIIYPFAKNIQFPLPSCPPPEIAAEQHFRGCSLDLNAFFASCEQ